MFQRIIFHLRWFRQDSKKYHRPRRHCCRRPEVRPNFMSLQQSLIAENWNLEWNSSEKCPAGNEKYYITMVKGEIFYSKLEQAEENIITGCPSSSSFKPGEQKTLENYWVKIQQLWKKAFLVKIFRFISLFLISDYLLFSSVFSKCYNIIFKYCSFGLKSRN